MTTVTVSSKYQIVIPRDAREAFQIKPGDKFAVWNLGGALELVRVPKLKSMLGIDKGAKLQYLREKKDREL